MDWETRARKRYIEHGPKGVGCGGETRVQELLANPADQFNELLDLVRDDIGKEDTVMRASISPEKRLAITLRFLATGETYRCLVYSSGIHESAISKIVPEVCRSIYRHLKTNIPDKLEAIVLAAIALQHFSHTDNCVSYIANAQEECSLIEVVKQAGNRRQTLL
ncbi:hypothetical protein J437_LFUL012917 [Ladona fulva]|uniref:Uncharacterized protein n=1 Tax=Ladona fulva TaxID=123851 RepID=A0A8K0KFB4_LADFU|nr:hypothetical protein J437_LFUL012917 [Ladona fulva]